MYDIKMEVEIVASCLWKLNSFPLKSRNHSIYLVYQKEIDIDVACTHILRF